MQTEELLHTLLSQNYQSPIICFHNEIEGERTIILDSENGTLFSILEKTLFSFKDQDDNSWSTAPKSIYINNKEYYPEVGDSIMRSDGVTHYFTTKEIVLKKALSYFTKFILYYGLQVKRRICHFEEVSNETKYTFKLSEKKFKHIEYKKAKIYISYN
ncbi:MAG: hypothetical protein J7574_05835 [Flavobacterium sp.]|uniref:hypothetical protein n=1 Tax=Flavobacterium sp. TaxID=239 RepID=UPI001B0BBA1D|nr:hypothetical protein [Flavobacterium sp.]MBO9583662.1 hypothetical protein [Flavobacterium sp.]